MSTAARLESDPRALAIEVTEDVISARLADGRTIAVPLAWSWRLAEATPTQRARCELLGGGVHIHWPEVDEDLSVRWMLEGTPAPRPRGR